MVEGFSSLFSFVLAGGAVKVIVCTPRDSGSEMGGNMSPSCAAVKWRTDGENITGGHTLYRISSTAH